MRNIIILFGVAVVVLFWLKAANIPKVVGVILIPVLFSISLEGRHVFRLHSILKSSPGVPKYALVRRTEGPPGKYGRIPFRIWVDLYPTDQETGQPERMFEIELPPELPARWNEMKTQLCPVTAFFGSGKGAPLLKTEDGKLLVPRSLISRVFPAGADSTKT